MQHIYLDGLSELFGDDSESIRDFLQTALQEIGEQKISLLHAMWNRDLTTVRELHHAFKPTFELLQLTEINVLINRIRENINVNIGEDEHQECIAYLDLQFDKLFEAINNYLSGASK
jgi:hypothetical protein